MRMHRLIEWEWRDLLSLLMLPASVEALHEDDLECCRIGFRHVLYYVGRFVMLRES